MIEARSAMHGKSLPLRVITITSLPGAKDGIAKDMSLKWVPVIYGINL